MADTKEALDGLRELAEEHRAAGKPVTAAWIDATAAELGGEIERLRAIEQDAKDLCTRWTFGYAARGCADDLRAVLERER